MKFCIVIFLHNHEEVCGCLWYILALLFHVLQTCVPLGIEVCVAVYLTTLSGRCSFQVTLPKFSHVMKMSYKVYAIISRPDLENMYTLLKPIHGGLGLLVEEVETHIKATALDAVKRLKGDNASLYVFFKY